MLLQSMYFSFAFDGVNMVNLFPFSVNEGNIVGQVTPEAGIFFGIPFSQPPIREFRWRRPRDPLKYESRYWDATYKRPGCQQICDQPASEYSCPHEVKKQIEFSSHSNSKNHFNFLF